MNTKKEYMLLNFTYYSKNKLGFTILSFFREKKQPNVKVLDSWENVIKTLKLG